MGFGDLSQWDYLAMALVKEYPALQTGSTQPQHGQTYFQFAGQPLQADWIGGDDYTGWTISNIVPGDLNGYYRQSTDMVARSYTDYITSIAPSDFETNAEYQQYQAQLTSKASAYGTLVTNAEAAFETWKDRFPDIAGTTGYFAWLAMLGTEGPGWNAQLVANQNEQTVINAEIAAFMASVDAPLSAAQAAVVADGNMEKFVNAGVHQSELVTTIDALSTQLALWTTKTAGAYELDITLNGETVQTGDWNEAVTTTESTSCCSVSTSTSIDWSRVVTDTQYSLQIQAVGANNFLISRGSWYDGTWLEASKVALPEGCRFTMDDFFGLTGSLHMVPVSAFVIYKPKVTLTISTQTYTENVQSFYNEEATVSIFGLEFSLAGGENKFVTDGPNNTKVITMDSFDDPSAQPLIFGMSSQSYYIEAGKAASA